MLKEGAANQRAVKQPPGGQLNARKCAINRPRKRRNINLRHIDIHFKASVYSRDMTPVDDRQVQMSGKRRDRRARPGIARIESDINLKNRAHGDRQL